MFSLGAPVLSTGDDEFITVRFTYHAHRGLAQKFN